MARHHAPAPSSAVSRRACLGSLLLGVPLAAAAAAQAPVVTPQAFGAVPDGTSDCSAAIQQALDAAGPAGGRVVVSGGVFTLEAPLRLAWPGLTLTGDGTLQAGTAFRATSRAALLEVRAGGVRIEGLTLDQRNLMPTGYSVRATGAAGLRLAGLVSRNTQGAFVLLGDACTEVEIAGCDHLGRGYGVLAPDSRGLAGILIRDCRFAHPGLGTPGDGVELNCPSHGARDVRVLNVTAQGYVGEALNAGIGFGFARVGQTVVVDCTAEDCEGDGFHWEQGSHDALAVRCRARRIGRSDPAGGNGSGFVAYDSERWLGRALEAQDCWYHGIALSAQGSAVQARGGQVLDCRVLGTGRDGVHATAQREFEISRCLVREPSRSAAGRYAGIHVGRQGGTALENVAGRGIGNVVELTDASQPLAAVVIRPQSVDVAIEAEVRQV